MAATGDVILLAGKGHEQNIIYGTEWRPWDEAGMARRLLREAGYQRG
jgi:UDP-N-acetylmuramoyl-L-alanyl-D-glutamate--2,6-diaminopimelate ligase